MRTRKAPCAPSLCLLAESHPSYNETGAWLLFYNQINQITRLLGKKKLGFPVNYPGNCI